MSRKAAKPASESINSVGNSHWTNIRFQALTVNNIDWAIEKTSDVIFQSGIVEHGDMGIRIEFKHDVYIAVGPVISARARAE